MQAVHEDFAGLSQSESFGSFLRVKHPGPCQEGRLPKPLTQQETPPESGSFKP